MKLISKIKALLIALLKIEVLDPAQVACIEMHRRDELVEREAVDAATVFWMELPLLDRLRIPRPETEQEWAHRSTW